MLLERGGPRRLLVAGLGCAALLLVAGRAGATPLDLDLLNTPDIVSLFIDVEYDATADLLTATGYAFRLDDDGGVPAERIFAGSFLLSASIDDTGALSGGTLRIDGTVPSLGFASGTLLVASLVDFGFRNAGGDPLEFLFEVRGGDAANLYGGIGATGGVILSATRFGGSFAVDWDNLSGGQAGTGSGAANVAPIPEASAVALVSVGLAGLAAMGRRRSQSAHRTGGR